MFNKTERQREETPCKIRNDFQRDKDRIIHSKSFRRLMHKTQVFIAPKGDHYRTRLTHTLEVSQIARTIARACGLDEDLCEAIAMGHDLGHTPFGHSGEDALSDALFAETGLKFRHNEQSLRVVNSLENDGRGLNLCEATKDGILCHSGDLKAQTKEGRIVAISDRIAYINHDIDDALRAKVLRQEDLPQEYIGILGQSHSKRINTLVTSMIDFYNENLEIDLQADIKDAMLSLRKFMFENVYLNEKAKGEEQKAKNIVRELFYYFLKHPEKIPSEYKDQDLHRNICDYIAGMTDRYAINLYKELFIPKNFSV